jgi:putative oxidoreductase
MGLLIMRLVIGSVLVLRTGLQLWGAPPFQTTLTSAAVAGSGLLLIAGLWTPLAGAVVAAVEITQVLRTGQHPLVGVLMATMAGALALLGPGRWSVDARLFGWKRIEPPLRKESSSAG